MNRLLSILVTLFILFLVYLWINHLMGSKRGENKEDLNSTEILENQSQEPVEEYTIKDDDIPAQEVQGAEDTSVKTEPEQKENQVPENKQEEPKVNPVVAPAEPAVKKTTTPPATPPTTVKTTESNGGVHLVIAGNFLTRANAEERVKELKKLGYSKAEVVNFELSEYHTACAGRYTDLNEARRIAKKIKDMNGIDTYVRHGN